MISFKTITALCLGAVLCTAQTINISGNVVDGADVGIPGATVSLENADISTTTDADGGFILSNESTAMQPDVSGRTPAANLFKLQNGRITVNLSGDAPVAISIHNVGGRLVYTKKQTYGSGRHVLHAPVQSTGICLYRVSIGDAVYSFKSSPFGSFSAQRADMLRGDATRTSAAQAKATAVIADVISVVGEGYLHYRDSMKTSDTSGIVIKLIANAGDVEDADGNVYQSVQIGDQVWTVENLRTTKYNDGTDIPHVTDSVQWGDLTTPGYCFYNNSADPAEQEKWGALYNWYAVNTGKLAPEGWRVPIDADWTALEEYLIAGGYNWDGTMTGDKVGKSLAAKTDWSSSSNAGTPGNNLNKNNAGGFSALPGGYRRSDGVFHGRSETGYWWSAMEYDVSGAYYRAINYGKSGLLSFSGNKEYGFSVRLIKGNPALPTYTVAYDGNGNTGGTVPASQTKTQGEALTLAANSGTLVRTGYTFAGWNTAASGDGTDYSEGSSYTTDTSITLYAKWTVTDVDGNVYTTITIGDQVWMLENLRTTKYYDGTVIPHVTDSDQWGDRTTPGYCWYGNSTDTAEQRKWGALYNWYAVNTGKLAPEGWRVPTHADWKALEEYLIGNGYNYDGTTSGDKIAKAMAAQTDWGASSNAGTPGNDLSKNNASGFSALPGGFRNGDGNYYYQSDIGSWWSATEYNASKAYGGMLLSVYSGLDWGKGDKVHGISVRLVRDLN